jgi:hypothetical protein
MTVYSQIGQNPDYSMISSPPVLATLMTMAQQILVQLAGVARSAGAELPTRQIVYMTPMPADCAQVGVLFSGWEMENNSGDMITCQTARWVGRFTILITRNSPAIPPQTSPPTPPTAEQMTKAAQIASDDAELLISLLQTFTEMASATIDTPSTEGGLQSVVATVLLPAFGGLP